MVIRNMIENVPSRINKKRDEMRFLISYEDKYNLWPLLSSGYKTIFK